MGLLDWGRFSPEHWFADLSEPIDHPLYLAFAVLQTVVLAAATFARLLADSLFVDQPSARDALAGVTAVAALLAGLGLLVLFFRWQLHLPFLSKRIWLYAWGLGAALAVAWSISRVRQPGAMT